LRLPGKETAKIVAILYLNKAWIGTAAVRNSAAAGGTNDWGPAMPGTACERNGHTARRPSFPFGSAFDFSALRTEHLCAPSFRQHAGTSLCTRSTASAGRRGPAPKSKTSKAASMRRKVYSGYSNVRTRATTRRYLTNLESAPPLMMTR
jgi:hypothetical protein